MKEALVFGGANSLDFIDVRLGVLRIPEVSLKLQEAQQIWDRHYNHDSFAHSFSFHTFLASDDSTFFNNIVLKKLCLSIVQIALADRYRRHFRSPECYIGNIQNDSALTVVCGRQSLAQFIMANSGVELPNDDEMSNLALLNGQALPRYQTFQREIVDTEDNEHFIPVCDPEMKLLAAIEHAIDEKDVRKLIHVGPGQLERFIVEALEPRELQIVESIDVDPMLGWFWRDMRHSAFSTANA